MAEDIDKKISDLTKKASIEGGEMIPVAFGGKNYSLTPAQVKEFSNDGMATSKELTDRLAKKVDKVDGKGLSTNDFTDLLNKKLDALENYDDTGLKGSVAKLESGLASANTEIAGVKESLADLMYQQADYYVQEYAEGQLDPKPIASRGAKEWLDAWEFFLLDTTDNAGEATTPVAQLNHNNLFRDTDGNFSPAVAITQAMYDECMTNAVYTLADGAYAEKYAAGAYDAAAQWERDKAAIAAGTAMEALYITTDSGATYTEVSHRLRPWETTDTKYTIGIGRKDTIYLLDGVVGNSGKTWTGLFSKATVWDGIDISGFALLPTAIAPCPVATIGGKTRNFFYLYKGESNCQGGAGQNSLVTCFMGDRTYPRVNDMNQINNMTFARANNSDTTSPVPFGEGGYHAMNAYLLTMELLAGTRAVTASGSFATGISSMDACSNEATWLANGGVRERAVGAANWSYKKWSSDSIIRYDASNATTQWTVMANSEYPKEQCMESQMAYSYAIEAGISEGVHFDFYGNEYWYKTVPNASTGRMNVKVYKMMSTTVSGYTSDGTAQDFEVEFVLRMSLYGGVNCSGDIFAYWGGGYEQVVTIDHPRSEGKDKNPTSLYLQPIQKEWKRNTASTSTTGWDFMKEYRLIWEGINVNDSWIKQRAPYAPWTALIGGSLTTGACGHGYTRNEWGDTVGQMVRAAVRLRGYASVWHYAAPRFLIAINPCSYAARINGGSAQVRIQVQPGAAALQAQ